MIPIGKGLSLRNKNMALKNFDTCLFLKSFLNKIKAVTKINEFQKKIQRIRKCNGANDDLKAQMDTLILEV